MARTLEEKRANARKYGRRRALLEAAGNAEQETALARRSPQRTQGCRCCRREGSRAGARPPAIDRHNPTARCNLGHLRRSRGPGGREAAPDPLTRWLERRRERQKRSAATCLATETEEPRADGC